MASKRLLKIGHWWLKNKERKVDFRFVERILSHRKRGRSARASPSPHHTLDQERTARFTARPFSALIKHARSAPISHRVHIERTKTVLINLTNNSELTLLSLVGNVLPVQSHRQVKFLPNARLIDQSWRQISLKDD